MDPRDKQEENTKPERDSRGRWKKGESGNLKGRPTGTVGLYSRIKQVLLREQAGVEFADVLAEVMVKEALKNPAKMWGFIKEFMDRDDGPVERVGPIVSIDMVGKVPQAPALDVGKGGAPTLEQHLSVLNSIAAERGLSIRVGDALKDVPEDAEAVITKKAPRGENQENND